jgi:methionyl-tRNA formyltransferase
MKIVFAGTPEFAVPVLQMLLNSGHEVCAVYTQPDRPAGRGRRTRPSPVKLLAQQHEVEVIQPESLRGAEDQARFCALQPDLLVVVAYGLILPQCILDAPLRGSVNVHASLLPRWRGAAPIQRAIMAGDAETGVTIMSMALKLDAGAMLHRLTCPITPELTAAELHDRLSVLGAEALSQCLERIGTPELPAVEQDESLVTYARKLEKQEALLDWTRPALDLLRQVNGLNPWPVAETGFGEERLRIWRAAVAPVTAPEPDSVLPGTVLEGRHALDVVTGCGVLRLLEVQLPGGKRLDAQSFLNAHVCFGMRLSGASE